tara:strand:+ start:717 stop:833 length:117 start_codon:yes stop_codon:yes gene_type:complete
MKNMYTAIFGNLRHTIALFLKEIVLIVKSIKKNSKPKK